MLKTIFFSRLYFFQFILLIGLFSNINAQQSSTINWYFGANDYSLRFVQPSSNLELLKLPHKLGSKGTAVATDPINGELLFYTDGINVYNNVDALINVGNPLEGSNTRNQGTVICHDPNDPQGDNSRFLIFTINNSGILKWSAFDKNLYFNSSAPLPANGAMAEINQTNGLPVSVLSEGMIIIPNNRKNGFWLLTHNAGTSSFNVTKIDNTGISTTNTTINNGPAIVNNLSYDDGSNKIFVSSGLNTNSIKILKIDPSNGTLTDEGTDLSVISNPNLEIYDAEFANDGNSLFISGQSSGVGRFIKVDITTKNPTSSDVSTILNTDISESYGLQYGIDGFLYHLYFSASDNIHKIGRIENPSQTNPTQLFYNADLLFNLSLTPTSIDLEALQFPSFLPPYNLVQNIDFSYSGDCSYGDRTFFFPHVTPDIDSITWDFGEPSSNDDNSSNSISGIHEYNSNGTYQVTMTVFLDGISKTITKPVTIQSFDLKLSIQPTQTIWCPQDFPITLNATAEGTNSTNAIIKWSNKLNATASNPSTEVTTPGQYYAVVTDPVTGCSVFADQEITDYEKQHTFSNVWYFGNNAGIDFNPIFNEYDPNYPNIQAITSSDLKFFGGNKIKDGPEGYAIYCDASGNPVVYSNGEQVYNKNNELVTNQLGGDKNASQSVFITKSRAYPTVYYIFYTQSVPGGNYNFSYSIFDGKANQGKGDLIRDAKNNDILRTILFTGNTERIIGDESVVLVHEYGNNNFRTYPLTENGIGSPKISNVGRVHQTSNNGRSAKGYMSFRNDKLAVAISESTNNNYIEVFDYKSDTYALNKVGTIDLTPETGEIYGVAISEDNILATLRNANGVGTKIFLWQLINKTPNQSGLLSEKEINDSRILIKEERNIDLGAMQFGPNNVLYIANDGARNLATISAPDNTPTSNQNAAQQVNYTLSATPNLSGTSRLGLPNYIDVNSFSKNEPIIEVSDICFGEEIKIELIRFLNDSEREIENYVLIIKNELGEQIGSFAMDEDNTLLVIDDEKYVPGIYSIEINVFNLCNSDIQKISKDTFTVFDFLDAKIIDVVPPRNCQTDFGYVTIDINSNDEYFYSVSGAIGIPRTRVKGPVKGFSINNLTSGSYYLKIESAISSCESNLSFIISDHTDYEVDLVKLEDANCSDASGRVSFSLSGIPPRDYNWEIIDSKNNFVESGNKEENSKKRLFSEKYTLIITDDKNCVKIDTVTITKPEPIKIFTDGDEFFSCGNDPIKIDVTTDWKTPITLKKIINNDTTSNSLITYEVIGDNDSLYITNSANSRAVINYAIIIEGEVDGPCTNEVPITATFSFKSENIFPSTVPICTKETIDSKRMVKFENMPDNFESVRWFDKNKQEIIKVDNEGNSNISGYTFTPNGDSIITMVSGKFYGELINLERCITPFEINLVEDCKARITTPTAFSPDMSKGMNDEFQIIPFLVAEQDFEFQIFNRWGELIFKSNDINFMIKEGWNGGYDNDISQPVAGGTYVYKIFYRNFDYPERGLMEKRGKVVLIR